MTTHHILTKPNGDVFEVRTNPGARPLVYLNGVLQADKLYEVVFDHNRNLSRVEKRKKLHWTKWFAWRPVTTVSGRRIWWQHIYRAVGNDYVDYDNWTWYFYADEFDLLRFSSE